MKKNVECGFCPSRRMLMGKGGATLLMGVLPAIRYSHAATAEKSLAERPETAAGRFGAMSCAQALATTYADLVGLQEQQAKNLATGFGLGMGRKQTCGAVTVMLMVSGLAGKGDASAALMDDFEKEMGNIQCAHFVDQFGYSRCRDLLRFASQQLNEHVFG